MRIPLIPISAVLHVGTLNEADVGRNSGAFSLEGRALSVSVHPEAWIRIARLGGLPIHRLTRKDGLLLDVLALDELPETRNAILERARELGLLVDRERWEAKSFDDELDDVIVSIHETEAKARLEIDLDDDEDGDDERGVRKVTVSVATPALAEKVAADPGKFRAEGRTAEDFAIMEWAENVLPRKLGRRIDGVWWRETLDPDRLSAPRGALFRSQAKGWNAEKTTPNDARVPKTRLEDIDEQAKEKRS
jgi:hypothetical protein